MIRGINHITLAVREIEVSFQFYKEVLMFSPLCKWDTGAYFLVGDFWFCLNWDEKRIPNPCYTHFAFTVLDEDFGSMSQRIIASGAHVFKENTSPGKSLYFLDPDGHKLEIHVGDWQSRIAIQKEMPAKSRTVEWYNDVLSK